jgi:hypothetical protein
MDHSPATKTSAPILLKQIFAVHLANLVPLYKIATLRNNCGPLRNIGLSPEKISIVTEKVTLGLTGRSAAG